MPKDIYTVEDINIIKKELMEISNYFDCYPFTHEQAYEIKNILERKFDPECVKKFICELRDCCEGAACLLDGTDYKTYKNDRKSMLAFLEKSSELLDTIRKGQGIYRLSTFSQLLDDDLSGLGYECQELAVTTGNLLSILIRKIKCLDDSNEQRLKGRPSADSKGIVAEIARIWETCFDKKPTKYIGGPFVEVVQKVLEGLNLKYESPERKIRAALKNR
jgi:hypothetical protein